MASTATYLGLSAFGLMVGWAPAQASAHAQAQAQALAQRAAQDPQPSQLCRAAIAATERATKIPDAFLSAISRVESGRPANGTINPWPWTVNAAGTGHFYATKAEAIDAVHRFLAAGIHSLDVGCLQVNLFYHPEAFASLDQAFDPVANTAYAAELLMTLFRQEGSWPRAAAAYHSMTPALGRAYQEKVLEAWATPDRPALDQPAGAGLPSPASAPAGTPGRAPRNGVAEAGAMNAPAGTAGPAPSFGFSRRMLLTPQKPLQGRSLSAYRIAPVQLAWRQATSPAIPR